MALQTRITIRQQLETRPGRSEWFATTKSLFNQIAAFYFNVIAAHPGVLDLSSKEALTMLERLTHATAQNADPVIPLSSINSNIPALFRRAAIHAALGAARSFQRNLDRWRKEKARIGAKGKRFTKRPPVPPRRWNRSVTFYAEMWRTTSPNHVLLKLFDGQTWRWVRFRVWGRAIPDGWQAGSPQVVWRGGSWWLHIPVTRAVPTPDKAVEQLGIPSTRLCAVDLNIGDALAVCTILSADGTVLVTRFIRGGRKAHGRRKCALGRIARKRSHTGLIAEGEQDNADLWRQVRQLDADVAHRVSRRIVDFALRHGATILVFEHLGSFQPERGRYSRRANSKRAYWLRGAIFRYAKYKAWSHGILSCRVNPRNTSRDCAGCGQLLVRYNVHDIPPGMRPAGYRAGAPLVRCPHCGMQGHADRNASIVIGQRLIARRTSETLAKPASRLGRPSKEEGVACAQEAGASAGLHTPSGGHGAHDGHGTARSAEVGAGTPQYGIPRFLRPQTSSVYDANTRSAAHAGVPEEAALL
jgi:IS605 OrfB family transposase